MKNIYKENGCDTPKNAYQLRIEEHDKAFKKYKILCNVMFVIAVIYAIATPIVSYLYESKILLQSLIFGIEPMVIMLIVHNNIKQKDRKFKDEIAKEMIDNHYFENQYQQ